MYHRQWSCGCDWYFRRSNASNPGGDEYSVTSPTATTAAGGSGNTGASAASYSFGGMTNGIIVGSAGAAPFATSCDSSSTSSEDEGVLDNQTGPDDDGAEKEAVLETDNRAGVTGLIGNISHLSLEHCSLPPLPTAPQQTRRPSSSSIGKCSFS